MPLEICEPCRIVPCLPEDDFFIPAPPVPPPGPSEQLRICNDQLTGECPYGETGYPVTISAGTFCTTIQFPAQTPPSQQLIDVIKGKMNAAAQAQLEARLAEGCHNITPPPPTDSCCKNFSWDAPTVVQLAPGTASIITSTGANFMEATFDVFCPAGFASPVGGIVDINGFFQYTRNAGTPCQFRVIKEVITSFGCQQGTPCDVSGVDTECNWDGSVCEVGFPFECFPNIGYGWNVVLGGPEPVGTTIFPTPVSCFQSSSFYTGLIKVHLHAVANCLFPPTSGPIDAGMRIRFRVEKC